MAKKRSVATPLMWIVLYQDKGDSLFQHRVKEFKTEREAVKFTKQVCRHGVMVIRGRFALGLDEQRDYKTFWFGKELTEEEKLIIYGHSPAGSGPGRPEKAH